MTIAIPDWLDFPDIDKPYVEQIYDRRESKDGSTMVEARGRVAIGPDDDLVLDCDALFCDI